MRWDRFVAWWDEAWHTLGLIRRSRTQILSAQLVFKKCVISKCLPWCFQIPPVWMTDGRPNRKNKAAFSNSGGATVWCCPKHRLTGGASRTLHLKFWLVGCLHDTELVWFNLFINRLKRELERRGNGGGGAGSKKAKKRRQRENGEHCWSVLKKIYNLSSYVTAMNLEKILFCYSSLSESCSVLRAVVYQFRFIIFSLVSLYLRILPVVDQILNLGMDWG